jgi:PAS domain S-box-containing protein
MRKLLISLKTRYFIVLSNINRWMFCSITREFALSCALLFTATNTGAAVIINNSHLHSASTLARILETQMAAIITINQRQEIVLINPAAEDMFGYARNALLNKHISILIPARFHAIHGIHIKQFGATGTTSRRMSDASNVVAVRADGTEFPIEAFISHVAEQGEHFFTVIMRDITARKFIEAELQKSHDEMRALSKRLVEVRELEGKRIARELHDELGQVLAAIRIDLTLLRDGLPADSPVLQKTAQGIDDLLVEAISSVRRISSELRPRPLDDLGLISALQIYAGDFAARYKIRCVVHTPKTEPALPEPVAADIFRMIQEALTNVAKHANATKVVINISPKEDAMIFRVSDNGQGFTPESLKKYGSFGVIGMRERALAFGGTIEINSEPGKGASLEITVPLTDGFSSQPPETTEP